MAVLRKRPQAKTTAAGTKRGLEPLLVVRVGARKLLETRPDVSVEGLQGSSMEAGRHGPDREDHFAERRAVAEQLQSHLWVRQFPQSFQNPSGLADSRLRVLVAELTAPNGPAEQLEVAVTDDLKVSREAADVNRGGSPAKKDKFAPVLGGSSAGAELQPYVAAPPPERAERISDGIPIASQAKVIQVGEDQLEATGRTGAGSLLQGRLQGQGEEKWAQGVALLHATLRPDGASAKHQPGARPIAEVGPRGQPRHVNTDLVQEALAVNGVKRVGEVQFEEGLAGAPPVAFTPLPGNLNAHLCPQRLSHSDLPRREVRRGLVFEGRAHGFGSQATQSFSHSNGTRGAVLFRQGHEQGSAQPWGDILVSPAPDKKVDDTTKVLNNLVRVGRRQRMPEVEGSQSRWAGARVLVKGL